MHSEKHLHIQSQKQVALHWRKLNDGHAKTLPKKDEADSFQIGWEKLINNMESGLLWRKNP